MEKTQKSPDPTESPRRKKVLFPRLQTIKEEEEPSERQETDRGLESWISSVDRISEIEPLVEVCKGDSLTVQGSLSFN